MAKVMIRGLVKARRDFERVLAKGLAPGAEVDVRAEASRITQQVEQICLRYKVSVDELPPQSRSAFYYLRLLQSEPLHIHKPAKPSEPPDPRLVESFQRVNQVFFASELEMPFLSWSLTRTRVQFGSYRVNEDHIVLSRSLAAPGVPDYVLDFVMYHEMLHKQIGIRRANGRKYSHTAEFRAAERQYPRYQEAKAYLEELAGRISSKQMRRKRRRL